MQTDQYLLMENAIASRERPNEAAAGNGAMALSFHVGRSCRAVPEQVRWAAEPKLRYH